MVKNLDKIVHFSRINTPLGCMIAVADENVLYFLGFEDYLGLKLPVETMAKRLALKIKLGTTPVLAYIERELASYFAGELKEFKTPLTLQGTSFQQQTWQELQKIPYGQTCSYAAVAAALGKPSASRAIGRANGANQCAIIVPCHRVINANGTLGGYASGIERKQWLLEHEKSLHTFTGVYTKGL